MADYLSPSSCVDSDHPAVTALAAELTDACASDLEKALALYYWVRDRIRYNPYGIALTTETLAASYTLSAGEGWCVPKAALLAALCRSVGIPARLGFADVRNHLSTERMRRSMETDVFYFHGYTSLFLKDKWVKATPAFNIELCEKFGLHPLEFDGRQDSLYHEFDRSGNRHMEYLNERGEYVDIPLEDMLATFEKHYPNMMLEARDWDSDVAREVQANP
jgi:transglutaminase-like putative cysteine protease